MWENESDKLQEDIRDTFEALLLALLMLDFGELGIYNNINITVNKWSKKYIIPILGSIDIKSILKEVNDYFTSIGLISPDKKTMIVLNKLGFNGIKKGTYLDAVSNLEPIKQQLKGYTMTAFASGRSRGEFTEGLKKLFENNGMVDRYFNTYAYDLYSQAHRIISNVKGDELGLTKIYYAGTIIETTRVFCQDRAGKIWDLETVKGWNDLNWRGKIDGVDVLVQLGGYNCRHYIRYTK